MAAPRGPPPRGASRSPSPQRDVITAPHPHAAITIRPQTPPLTQKRVSLAQVTKRMQWDSDIDDDDLDSTDSSGAYSVRSATSSFGDFGEGYIRFSYANSIENINQAIDKIKELLR